MAEIDRIPLEQRIADLKPYIEAADRGQSAFYFSPDLDAAYLIDGILGHNLDHTGENVMVVNDHTRQVYAGWVAELKARTTANGKRKITLEEVIRWLASVCDGARMRDRQGFGKTTVFDGHRLDALRTAGLPWSASDLARARELVHYHARQAAELMTKDERKRDFLEDVFRGSDRMPTGERGNGTGRGYRYACLSGGLTHVWLYSAFDQKLLDRIRADLKGLAHGERDVPDPFFNSKTETTWSGDKARRPRWEIPYNGTTREKLLPILAEFGFAVDPEIHAGIDKEFDDLMRHRRIGWLANLSAFGKRPEAVACFDTYGYVQAFHDRLMQEPPSVRKYEDGIWYVRAVGATRPLVDELVDRFGVTVESGLAGFLGRRPRFGTGGTPRFCTHKQDSH